MDDRERYQRERNIGWVRMQRGVQLLTERAKLAKLAAILLVIIFAILDGVLGKQPD
jgi:hypothetical protein